MMAEIQLRFDYEALDTETRRFVLERAEKIHNLARMTAAGIVQIGQYLTEAKTRLEHGKFLEWIEKEFAWKRTTAWRFMEVFEKVKCSKLEQMEIDVSALYLIAAPSTPEPVRQEVLKIAMSGEHVSHGTVKAVIAEYNKTGDADKAVGQIFRAVAEARKENAAVLPSPADARRTAIATGAHTLDRNGVYQPPMTVEQQGDYKADMFTTDPVFQFCRWVNTGTISAPGAARIIGRRQWRQHYQGIDRAIEWLKQFKECLNETNKTNTTG
jgi:hypothetical protein